MSETTRYEVERRIRGSIVLTAAISLYSAFIVWYFTVLEGVNTEEVFEELPPAMVDAFGIESLSTIEGFLGAQIFNFVWLLGLGLYFAYMGGGIIASEIESERIDVLLSFPISRSQLFLEKFVSILFPILVVNTVGGVAIYGLVLAVDESIDLIHLLLAHVLSIPYLLVCAGIGGVFSVAVNRTSVAEKGAVGVVFVLYLIESIVGGADEYDWIQYLSPTQYYEPTPVLIDGTFEFIDSAILLVTLLGLLLLGQIIFSRRDL